MSLMTYDDAFPWAESLRIELLNETIPAWHPLKLTARELDLVLVWATGGAPRGKTDNAPPPVTLPTGWPSGRAGSGTADAGAVHARGQRQRGDPRRRAAADAAAAGRTLRAVDLKPGTPAIVRGADAARSRLAPARRRNWPAGCPARTPPWRLRRRSTSRPAPPSSRASIQAHVEVRGPAADRRQHDRAVLRRRGGAAPDPALTVYPYRATWPAAPHRAGRRHRREHHHFGGHRPQVVRPEAGQPVASRDRLEHIGVRELEGAGQGPERHHADRRRVVRAQPIEEHVRRPGRGNDQREAAARGLWSTPGPGARRAPQPPGCGSPCCGGPTGSRGRAARRRPPPRRTSGSWSNRRTGPASGCDGRCAAEGQRADHAAERVADRARHLWRTHPRHRTQQLPRRSNHGDGGPAIPARLGPRRRKSRTFVSD